MVEEVAACIEINMEAIFVLARWTLQRFHCWSGWVGASIKNAEHFSTLKLLARLALLNKATRSLVVHTPELVASRLSAVVAAHPVAQKI